MLRTAYAVFICLFALAAVCEPTARYEVATIIEVKGMKLMCLQYFNHSNPRDVQSIADSPRYGQFFNHAWREYRGKFVFEF